ncbi:hypothetical protein Q4488_04565 [Amphritea sp. 1_MG-2023]|uniref:hypothetical protein n=1 Tax=Amphritea sp. 1_MG-2023 TaxID=3062670 RepID=UPI0026E45391|nr:hypothetical protein [Amphritea sp. 1_MG-2023]MDO6562653.1 hypothetical protein [Amphritea sp. 1_MG-2023]
MIRIAGLGETVSRNLVKQLISEHWLVGEKKQPLRLEVSFEGGSILFPHLWSLRSVRVYRSGMSGKNGGLALTANEDVRQMFVLFG